MTTGRRTTAYGRRIGSRKKAQIAKEYYHEGKGTEGEDEETEPRRDGETGVEGVWDTRTT